MTERALIAKARGARRRAQARYSGFAVGAALEDKQGRVWTGCNIENATYGLTVCAERVALWKALSEGVKPHRFTRIAVVTGAKTLTPPCGACRQLLWEYCGDIPVTLANLRGGTRTVLLSELFPDGFNEENLA
jgi:cytidine deaminase